MMADEVEGELFDGDSQSTVDDNRQLTFNTLDEPVKDTILRDLKAVGEKFLHVLYPRQSQMLLQEWDLWGPLVLCVVLAVLLQTNDSSSPEFAQLFVIYWFGAVVVTVNTQLLGGTLSFFQSLCVLGYCVLPLIVSLVVCRLLLLASAAQWVFITRCLVALVAFVWSTVASTAFLAQSQTSQRKLLVVYPICLFYFFICWLVVSYNSG